MQLHRSLDALYLEILSSPDPALSAKKVFSEFQAALTDYRRAVSERFLISKNLTVSAELNLSVSDILKGAVGGAALATLSSGFSVPLAAAAGAIASALKIQLKSSAVLTSAAKSRNLKLGYLAKAMDADLLLEPSAPIQ